MNIFLVEVEILQLNTKTRLPEVCFWKARGDCISLSTRFYTTNARCGYASRPRVAVRVVAR